MNTKMSKPEMLAAINQQHGTLLELGLDGKDAVISLVKIAEITGRRHDDLLVRVRSFIEGAELGNGRKNSGVDFRYEPATYLDAKGETRPTYNLNREAFYQFVLSMTGKHVATIRDNYILAFKAFEQLALHEMHHEVAAVRLQLEHKQRSESIDELIKRVKPIAQMMINHRQLQRSYSRQNAYRYFNQQLPDFKSKFPKIADFNKALHKINWICCDTSSAANGQPWQRAQGRGFVIPYDDERNGHQLSYAKITALGMLYLQERMEQLYEQSVA
ncbi:Rha family transcriptional regulator [Aeromonas finlandensis]|uniref:Rha family transcriptional regulator n=1 Tax=Aeromonas finlandensis TaxID=1543375 RepID=UPI00051C4530|nr:Rha family transcriptional regulator [Aeromonas finlandensis]